MLNGTKHTVVTTLPDATVFANKTFSQGGKLWFSDGVSWIDATATGGGGGGPSGTVVVTMGQDEYTLVKTVAAIGVTPSSRILCSLGAFTDDDENSAELLDVAAISVAAGTDQITVTISFTTPTAGAIRINWSAF